LAFLCTCRMTTASLQTPVVSPKCSSSPSPKFRCGYPGCSKRYASTDGVRKHARKTHTQWLRDVDEQSALRDHKLYGNKPSTYCIMEADGERDACHAGTSGTAVYEPERQPLRACFSNGLGDASGSASPTPNFFVAADAHMAPLSPASFLLPLAEAGCKRPRSMSLLENAPAAKKSAFDLCNWSKASGLLRADEFEADALDTDSDSGRAMGSGEFCLTPLTVPLPRPLADSGEISPFQLRDELADGPELDALVADEHCAIENCVPHIKPEAELSGYMDEEECAAFLSKFFAA